MQRPITLFTGQWADLPFVEVCKLAEGWGYDGLEIACWGDHFEVDKALNDENYVPDRLELLERHHLKVFAISAHLVGQAVCDDPIDERHENILPARVWGDGKAEGVRRRAAEELKNTARAAQRLGVKTVIGFTGSSIWYLVAMFPPVPAKMVEPGYEDFAARFNPILDVFDEVGVRFAHEVHPSEIAYDYWTTVAALDALGRRPAFGLNFDPSHFIWQDLDPVGFLWDFRDRIYHVDCKESKLQLNGRNGRLGSHLPWGDPRRGWDFASTGHGDVPWEAAVRMLNAMGYEGADLDRMGGCRHGPSYRGSRGAGADPATVADETRRRRLSTPPSARSQTERTPSQGEFNALARRSRPFWPGWSLGRFDSTWVFASLPVHAHRTVGIFEDRGLHTVKASPVVPGGDHDANREPEDQPD